MGSGVKIEGLGEKTVHAFGEQEGDQSGEALAQGRQEEGRHEKEKGGRVNM